MNDSEQSFWIGASVTFLVMLAVLIFALQYTDKKWEEKAIKQGKAEYYIDGAHYKKFRWKENK